MRSERAYRREENPGMEDRLKNESPSLVHPPSHALFLPLAAIQSFSLYIYLYVIFFFLLNVTHKCWLFLTGSSLVFPPSLMCSASLLHRSLQPGSVSRRYVWPAAAGTAAAWSHPDPEAAGGGGCVRRLQHWTQRPQLLPARMSAQKPKHEQQMIALLPPLQTEWKFLVFFPSYH